MAILAEKYATDYKWYVDVILNLIRLAGDYVSEEVWYRVIQIVVNREDVQGYAAKTVFEVRSGLVCRVLDKSLHDLGEHIPDFRAAINLKDFLLNLIMQRVYKCNGSLHRLRVLF